MITSLFSQKNVCAALGFLMAITIVWKAKVETSLIQQTARFEYTEPTPHFGNDIDTETFKVPVTKQKSSTDDRLVLR